MSLFWQNSKFVIYFLHVFQFVFMETYLDDIIIYGKTFDMHLTSMISSFTVRHLICISSI